MKTAGIIAEYNPFHNGHQYQMETVRHLTGADFVIVAMSGDFLQRGVPAIADKYTRTRMALLGGADLVLELPAVMGDRFRGIFFAAGGVQLLGKTGVVDTLCYGCETPEKELMQAIVEVLSKNASDYQMLVSYDMKQGNPFPAARSHAMCSLLPSFSSDAVSSFLASPNNILALEYEKAIARWNSINSVHDRTFSSMLIQRIGEGYHSTKTGVTYASATAIRNALLAPSENDGNHNHSMFISTGSFDFMNFRRCFPDTSASLLATLAQQNLLLDTDAFFSQALYTRLWALYDGGYADFADCGKGSVPSNRPAARAFFKFFAVCRSLKKQKNTTYTRICRALLHILLNIRQDDYAALWQPDGIPYLRVLGFRRNSSALLSSIKKRSIRSFDYQSCRCFFYPSWNCIQTFFYTM